MAVDGLVEFLFVCAVYTQLENDIVQVTYCPALSQKC